MLVGKILKIYKELWGAVRRDARSEQVQATIDQLAHSFNKPKISWPAGPIDLLPLLLPVFRKPTSPRVFLTSQWRVKHSQKTRLSSLLSEPAKPAPVPQWDLHWVVKVWRVWIFARYAINYSFITPSLTNAPFWPPPSSVVLLQLNWSDTRQEFNARTQHIQPGTPIPARVTIRPDRSFTFDLHTPTTSWLLLKAANVPERKGRVRGAQNAGSEVIGTVSLKHVYEIAKIKQSELRLSGLSLQGLCKSVIAQAKSIGVQVVPWWGFFEG